MVQRLKVLAGLAEDLDLNPSSHMGLTAIYNARLPLLGFCGHMLLTHAQKQSIRTQKI